ncbi:glycoside hydrolase family 15 protein [Thermothielavioides terrestris NRRL 8126]|uniref:Glucoamylase n=1 Tax=Thermothielavioides terrestris (strain ATCC 38088 / NRRL 8126) TaxID=578455 RepID=G2RHN1_THETT|nr:glycoside hydrolase family 15 protein [Thermothielavioides terrestris NRRL 8126]AEO71343.1 glycoside hydrolase family 15 protein [Thermothielavioides terrestris NRRL 8126]
MHAFSSLLVLGACAVQAVLGRPEADPRARREGALLQRFVDSFISSETSVAWSKLLCNVGPDGCAAAGAASGVVVASPSKSNPDYWYTWTRDAALVLTGVVDSLARNYSATLQSAIQNYVVAQAKLQEVSNPSGSLADGAGLGEPKFMVDLTPFSGQWGRPQRDGPALRAIALARYAKWLIGNGYASTAKDVVWPVIKNDLAYIAQYWNETGFDLWEEVPCSSFFTIASNHRALVEGAALAAQLGTECRACITAAPHILCFQQTFWKADGGYVVSNINTGTARTGKDVNSVLASIHTFDPAVGCDATTFQPCSDKALSNHKAYVDSFRSLYPINAGIPQGRAVAVGRYAEDVYFNGNPWYLANFATAEQLYDAIYVWKKQGSITVTPLSLTFFQDLVPSLAAGTYPSSSQTYQAILSAVSAYADDFMAVAAKYTPADGSLAEQYDRATGAPTSAADLTWSYAAFLSAADRRAGIVPTPGWSAAAAHGPTLPSTCARVQVAGSYAPATAAASSASPFPPSQTPNPTATPPAAPAPLPSGCCAAADAATVYVAFHARVATRWGEAVRVVGSAPELGAWDPVRAVPLSASAYSAADPLWSITVPISAGADAAGRTVLYKYVKVQPDGSVVWESDPDRRLVLAVGSGEVVPCPAQTVNGTWR